jgi:hypothetical protein
MTRRVLLLACLACVAARSLAAQEEPGRHHPLRFLGGAAFAFVAHESGHVGFDLLFHASPHLAGVRFGPIPFFSIDRRNHVTDGQAFAISSAGFWVQEAMNEWILDRHPQLRHEDHPALRGMVVFNVLMPVGYSMAAFLRTGPIARDPHGMAEAVGLPEPVMGVVVLAPALLDGYRYLHPEKRWAAWASRVAKVGSLLLTVRAAAR